MKIFALETDDKKLIKSFLSSDEDVVLTVKFSSFLFVVRTIKAAFLTVILIAIASAIEYYGAPALWTWVATGVVWFFWIVLRWITAYIDWRHDILIVTTEEVVIVDQSSLFRRSIRQMNLENIASVSDETQFGGMLPIGVLRFELKEGTGKTLTLGYIPHADKVASIISDSMVVYQRRRAAAMHVIAHGATPGQAANAADQAVPVPPPKEITG